VPVRIQRNLPTAVLGFSVDFSLSSALTAAGTDVLEGSFLSGANPTTSFNVIDHGGGHFTADAVTLGPPCGASALDGLLFTVQVGSNAVGGIGSLTIDGVRLRDCSNDTLPATAGSAAAVAIHRSPPIVTLLAPNGGESWLAGSQHDVTWAAADSAGIATDGVDLELTTDAVSWTSIATGLANTGSYLWTLPATPSATARVRVTARDIHGNSAADLSDADFTIAAGTSTTLAAAPDPGVFTETVTLTATVAPPEASGSVEFFEGTTSLGSATVSGGTASLALTTLAVGSHVLTATYHGDAQHAPSTSAPVTLEVKARIVATAGPGGHITPAGVTLVSLGATPSFAFAADPGQHVLAVTVDGAAVATTSPYTFAPVSANHAIDVQFAANPPVAALSHLDAFQVHGGDADGTIPLRVHWTDAVPPGSTVEVYRARFGGYSRYDEAGGTEPTAPASPDVLGDRWAATSIHASDQTDELNGAGARDVWFYVAFVKDSYGTCSPPSNVTIGRPNYLLGDVSDGTPNGIGVGNNVVDLADISALGASYGLNGPATIPVSYLDVGPTLDYSVETRPRTDMAIDFEDLVMFAINFETQPGAPALAARVSTATGVARAAAKAITSDLLIVQTPERVNAGDEFDVPLRLEGPGDLQALSVALRWNGDRVVPLSVRAGAWLAQLGGVALSPKPGIADLALLGTGGPGLAGGGEVAVVRFRSLASGEPGVGIERVQGRDPANHPVEVASTGAVLSVPRADVTALAAAFPNPFRRATTIAFSLAQAGPVSVAVFGVDGRCVKTLASGTYDAGGYRLEWNGRDDRDAAVPAGIYFVRMNAGGRQLIRRIACIR
jgi:hypothetical protein